jgi:hypothetical protein
MELAERAWRLGPQAGMDWYSGPGYPVVVGWVFGLIGDLEFAGRATSFLFGIATLVGVGLLTRRMFPSTPGVAAVAVGLLAVHTTFIRHAVMAETDTAYGCWLVWSVLFTWELRQAGTIRNQVIWSTLAALALGCGYLTRPEAVPLAGLLALWYLRPEAQSPSPLHSLTPSPPHAPQRPILLRRLKLTLLIVALFLVVAAPYLLQLRAELGRWSLSGKERAFAMKYASDRRDTEAIESTGVLAALAEQPTSLVRRLPEHLRYGVPEFVKSLHPVVLVLAVVAFWRRKLVGRAAGAIGLLLWVTVPFLVFFGITYPRPRYFMQSMPIGTILAAVGAIELAGWLARWRTGSRTDSVDFMRHAAGRRAYRIAIVTPVVVVVATSFWSLRRPIEQSLATDRAIGEQILELVGPGRRVLSFSVTAFHARAERVPLWGPMQGIVRMHGYVKPLTYEELVAFARNRRVEYFVVDRDILADCPEFLDRVRPTDFELVIDSSHDLHRPCRVYRSARLFADSMRAN